MTQREQKQMQVQQQVSQAESWQAKLAAARTGITDFDTVLNTSEAPVASHVAELIMEHDQGAKVAHHFALHPEELAKVNDMSPAKAAFEIGRLATKFEIASEASSSKPAAAEQISKAPPPTQSRRWHRKFRIIHWSVQLNLGQLAYDIGVAGID